MNSVSETQPPPPVDATGATRPDGPPPPANWREALLALIAARISLIQIESKEAAKDAARRLACLIVLILCAFFAWALLLAGGIAVLSSTFDQPWHIFAFIAAVLHLIAATLLSLAAKSPGKTAFPVTRAEFQKDREWIENFKKTPKSSD